MERFGRDWINNFAYELDHHKHQYESSQLTILYHNWVMTSAVKMAALQGNERILDYGCGHKRLKMFLPQTISYLGYDVRPELSEIEDPRSKKYDKIICLQVLMLLDSQGLSNWLESLLPTCKDFTIMIPSRNFLKDRILDPLLGLSSLRDQMVRSQPSDVYEVLSTKLIRTDFKNLCYMGECSRWQEA